MCSNVVQAFSTLDGVVQAGGGPKEDRDGGVEHGGWTSEYDSEDDTEVILEWERKAEALLLCRRIYEIFSRSWGVWDENAEGLQGELTRRDNHIPKYVASRTLTEVGWQNSQLLGPDVPAAVQKLRAELGEEIRVRGSTRLVKSLARHDLIDEYQHVIYPLVLGTGRELFSDGVPASGLALTDTRTLPAGALVNTYRRPDLRQAEEQRQDRRRTPE